MPVSNAIRHDPWTELRRHTPARIALGSSGDSLPTDELLRFGVAHAQARDAVHLAMDAEGLRGELRKHGFNDVLELESAAPDRPTYLRRPDLGRQLSARSRQVLGDMHVASCDVLCVVGDGLSATAVHRNAVALLTELRSRLAAAGLQCGPVVLAHQARVALGDPIGEALNARSVLVLIGERPGLSSPDSLGAYFTWAPRSGLVDSQRNCVSNIRAQGLCAADAADKLAWLVAAARSLGASGVALKDESSDAPARIEDGTLATAQHAAHRPA
jgi:ethanolamine ammonia-lyase small subunit